MNQPAYMMNDSGYFERVKVTRDSAGGYWVENESLREEVDAKLVFADTDENKTLIKSIRRLDNQIEKLVEKRNETVKQMKPFTVKKLLTKKQQTKAVHRAYSGRRS